MSTSTQSKFSLGQVVKFITKGRLNSDSVTVPATIVSIWKNGTIKIADYLTGSVYNRGFTPDGYVKSNPHWATHDLYIEPLSDGETPDMVLENEKAKNLKMQESHQRISLEKQQRISDWWNSEGKPMWEARIKLPYAFLDEEVCLVRFTIDGREYAAMTVVKISQGQFELTVGGLTGKVYKTDEGDLKVISGYSSIIITGQSLEEVLYTMTR